MIPPYFSLYNSDCKVLSNPAAPYHNGSGKITANALSGQTSGTATSSDILSGKTAWVNGSKISGGMGSLAAATYTPGTSDKTIAAGKYLSGTQTIKGDSNLKAENIKKGITIFGVRGSACTAIFNDDKLIYQSARISESSIDGFEKVLKYTNEINKDSVAYRFCIDIHFSQERSDGTIQYITYSGSARWYYYNEGNSIYNDIFLIDIYTILIKMRLIKRANGDVFIELRLMENGGAAGTIEYMTLSIYELLYVLS